MVEDDFKAQFGFDKPQLDETLVFTCKAGIRAEKAANLAVVEGYSNIVVYTGGSDEWFS